MLSPSSNCQAFSRACSRLSNPPASSRSVVQFHAAIDTRIGLGFVPQHEEPRRQGIFESFEALRLQHRIVAGFGQRPEITVIHHFVRQKAEKIECTRVHSNQSAASPSIPKLVIPNVLTGNNRNCWIVEGRAVLLMNHSAPLPSRRCDSRQRFGGMLVDVVASRAILSPIRNCRGHRNASHAILSLPQGDVCFT
jgi:hypothetical protein